MTALLERFRYSRDIFSKSFKLPIVILKVTYLSAFILLYLYKDDTSEDKLRNYS